MITYRKVREDDLELNSKIEDLNIKVKLEKMIWNSTPK